MAELKPWKDLDPQLEHFAGKGIYRGTVTVPEREEDCRYVLELGDVGDTR